MTGDWRESGAAPVWTGVCSAGKAGAAEEARVVGGGGWYCGKGLLAGLPVWG